MTVKIISDITEYYSKFPDAVRIDREIFLAWSLSFRNSRLDADDKTLYVHLINKMCNPVSEDVKAGILSELHELRLATALGNVVQKWNDGDLPHMPAVAESVLNRFKMDAGCKASAWIQEDINSLLDEVQDNNGVHWRLQALNKCMRGLRPGDTGIIAARPDRGKTTFFSSEAVFMAAQLPPELNVIWLNNEGVGKRIVPRLYQSAIGCTLSELIAKRDKGTLEQEYSAVVGRPDRIRVYDIHSMHTGQVERILEQSNPGIVIADMIDHIKGFQSSTRTDLQLEEMYKWFRECAVRYSFIGLASSQISADGDGLQFPTLGMLKDSKTGKQGACDFQLMIGARNDEGWGGYRYLSLPKNKLRREGSPGDPRCEVLFKPETARYEDLNYDV